MSMRSLGILINLLIILVSLVGTFILVRRLKFDDNNSRIIFLLYIAYWIPPLLCRDYSISACVHMNLPNSGFLIWLPAVVFGAVGIVWRPLNDILTFKLKSRKLIVYISLLIQLLTILPFMLYPSFITNIVQSIGTGVGASGIGLFTLMFNENQTRKKKFLTVSLFAIPPIIAGFIVSAIESFVASFIVDGHTNEQYLNTIWYIWMLALIFIITSFILVFFVKEKRETLYQDNKYKEPIVKKYGHWKMVLLCLCAIMISFFRWSTIGPFAGLQLTYIAQQLDAGITNVWEGYIGIIYSLGCLIGAIISGLVIVKSQNKVYQPILVGIAILVWAGYLIANMIQVNVPVFVWTMLANGIGFGLLWNVFMQIVLNKFYFRQNLITPIGVFNMSLSIGICLGSLFIGLARYLFYDFHGAIIQVNWDDFIRNNIVSSIILIAVLISLGGFFAGYFALEQTHKEKLLKVDRKIATIGENEL